MRLILAMAAAAAVLGMTPAADAQEYTRRAIVQSPASSTTVRHTDEYGRTRTKVIVTKRSYLDGGTEVMPGDVQNNLRTDFIDMNQQPTSVISNNNVVPIRPVSDPFYLPGKNNPYFR